MNKQPPLLIQNLVKRYGPVKAVNDVTFDIQPGEVFGLLGPNGAGKTTIISTIMTLQKPTSGSIEVFGVDVQKKPRFTKSQVGFVPQELISYGFFTTEEILRYHATFFGIHRDDQHQEYLLKKLQLS